MGRGEKFHFMGEAIWECWRLIFERAPGVTMDDGRLLMLGWARSRIDPLLCFSRVHRAPFAALPPGSVWVGSCAAGGGTPRH